MRPTDTSSGLAQSLLTEVLNYDPETGVFTRKIARSNNHKAGDVAGYVSKKDGYRHIWVGERTYSAARLAWLYMTGEWPQHTVDHIDLNRTNDCWSNLRAATQAQNVANRGKPKSNKTGFKGVSRLKNGRFYACIKFKGKCRNLGNYATAEEASEAYAKAITSVYGEFARTE